MGERLTEFIASHRLKRAPRLYDDTTESMKIDYGDVIYVDRKYFFVTGYEKEGRFGIDDEPKFWVKRAVNLENGESRILKLVFHEQFAMTIGPLKVTCYRHPEKEAKVLDLVRGHRHFMQGYSVEDTAGNCVRIIEIIRGKRLDKHIAAAQGKNHREYFEQSVPDILRQYLECVHAIGLLHEHGLKHGDIRRDHIYIERRTGLFKWIDFDYDFYLPERPFAHDLLGLGNILLFIIGRGEGRPVDIYNDPELGPAVIDRLTTDDLSLFAKDRIVNLKKLYPYIPEELNRILMHFSQGTMVFYDTVEELYTELKEYVDAL
ncbi:MAG TPA: serine/threonine protein kinase [Thermodesulfobacteriaceae bacterium]|nr:serine/threonine protein kinase [Thermodesulfobacteriaceae bacterium]